MMIMIGKDILTQLMMEIGLSQYASNKLHPIKIPSHDDDDWEGYPHSVNDGDSCQPMCKQQTSSNKDTFT